MLARSARQASLSVGTSAVRGNVRTENRRKLTASESRPLTRPSPSALLVAGSRKFRGSQDAIGPPRHACCKSRNLAVGPGDEAVIQLCLFLRTTPSHFPTNSNARFPRRLRRPPSRPSFSHPRGGGVERRQAHSFFLLVARVRGATPALVRRGPVPVRPGPLSALHRAIFGRGPTLASPAVEHRSRSDCPRQAVLPGGRGPDLPRCGFAPQSRDATPGFVRRSSPETSPPEPGWEFCTINSLRSQCISSLRSRIRSQQPRSDRPRSLFRLDPA
jgi:hypothetical protein